MRHRKQRVLIVDPDPLFAGRLEAVLCSEGYDVETVSGITIAAQRLKDVDFGCVVLDEDLPEMKGHEAVSILKTLSHNVQVIMTATSNTPELESRIRRQDILYYHVKSFDMHELQLAVRDAFRKSKNRIREHYFGDR